MRSALLKTITHVTLLLIIATAGATGQSDGAVTEVDPGLGVAIDITRRVRLDSWVGREKSEELSSSKIKAGAGISFRLKPHFKTFLDALDRDKQHVLVLGASYEFSRGSEVDATTIEHRLMFDATGRYELGRKMLVSDRNRFEFRWINGAYHFRYRNRLKAERPVTVKIVKELTLNPYIAAEAFWDQRFSKWNQFKFSGGVEIPLIKRSSFDLYYERQHCVTCSDPHTNIFGLTLNFYPRRKT